MKLTMKPGRAHLKITLRGDCVGHPAPHWRAMIAAMYQLLVKALRFRNRREIEDTVALAAVVRSQGHHAPAGMQAHAA